jgi:toxin ParE1/3/4
MTYRLIAPARIEYRESILFYLEEASAEIAADFDDEIQTTLNLICKAPFLAKQVSPGIRERLVDRFPFSIIYSVEDGDVIVLTIKHHRRKADHWKSHVR